MPEPIGGTLAPPSSEFGGSPEPSSTAPIVKCDRVSVRYGKNWALKDVSAEFHQGAVGLLGPERRWQEHADQDAPGVREARPGADDRPGHERGDVAARDSRPHRLHAGERRAHSRDECGVVCRLLRAAVRAAARRLDAARSRGAVLRRPGGSPLSQRRDLFHRHEAAHQAGSGAGARSRFAVSRRADQRHGSQGPRRDARADPRPGPQQRAST